MDQVARLARENRHLREELAATRQSLEEALVYIRRMTAHVPQFDGRPPRLSLSDFYRRLAGRVYREIARRDPELARELHDLGDDIARRAAEAEQEEPRAQLVLVRGC